MESLLFTGYVTYVSCEIKSGKKVCNLIIPNQEIKYLYMDLINKIFQEMVMGGQSMDLLQAITEGNTLVFSDLLQNFIMNTMSSFDIPDTEPERSYHLFVLGLLTMLQDTYEIKSNKESGLGRYDIMLIPKKPHKMGGIIEFKKLWPHSKETIEEIAQAAIEQIIEKNYLRELQVRGIHKIIAYGIGLSRKKVCVQSKVLSDE